MSDIATIPAMTTVELSGKLEDGTTITQVYPVQHPSGEQDSIIIARAFGMLKNAGGLLVDTADGMDFYLGSKFVGPIQFKIKKVSLAGAGTMSQLQRGPQIVQ